MAEGKEIEIVDERDYPNCKKIKIKTTVNGEEYTNWFGFQWHQIESEKYMEAIKRHVKRLRESTQTKHNIRGQVIDVD